MHSSSNCAKHQALQAEFYEIKMMGFEYCISMTLFVRWPTLVGMVYLRCGIPFVAKSAAVNF